MTQRMRQAEIILGRVLSQIQILKKTLAKEADFGAYNDFMIIGEIAPRLPAGVLAQLLQRLRAMND